MDWFGKKNELHLLELLKNFRSYDFDFSQFNCFVCVKCISLAVLFPFYSKSLPYLSHITTNSKTLWFVFPIIVGGGLLIKKQAYAWILPCNWFESKHLVPKYMSVKWIWKSVGVCVLSWNHNWIVLFEFGLVSLSVDITFVLSNLNWFE